MKLTTKNLLIVLVVLGVAFAASQLTKRSGKTKALRSELVSIDTAQVSKIEISSLQGEVVLSDSPEGWKVQLEDGSQKETKEGSVTALIASLQGIKPGRLAAKSPDKWKDYQVDSTGTQVKVYEKDELSTDIIIGRFGMEGQQRFYSFVRLNGDNEVYAAPNFMGMSIGKDAASFRDNTVFRFKKDSLTSIKFDYPDSSFSLNKNEKWFLGDNIADSTSVAKYLNSLNFVSSKNFYDGVLSENPLQTVTFSYSNRPELVLNAYQVDSSLVLASSENKNELFKDQSVIEKIYKGKSYFVSMLQ